MTYDDFQELLDIAREKFINGEYGQAENLLQQLLLKNNREPEIFQMLATIFYDRGKFNKAIKTFKRALEIDPTYTDASIGLSIILNDLGRYDEGKEVFAEAQEILDKRKAQSDPFIDRLLAKKHEELGDLYFENKRHDEALEQFLKARHLYDDKTNITLKIVNAFLKSDQASKGVKELRQLIQDYPHFLAARHKLAELYYESGRVLDAVETWEGILLRDPDDTKAKNSLRIASESQVTELNL